MVQADVDWNGETLRIFSVHLQTTGHGKNLFTNILKRAAQSDLLKAEVKKSPYPVIVCGDFNDIPLSYSLLNLLTELVDKSIVFKGSYQPLVGLFKIDYVLTSKNWMKKEYRLIPNQWSDHKLQYFTGNINK